MMTAAITRTVWLSAALLFGASSAAAAPRVVADIAPVHSLVAQVMQGVGEPHLLIPPGASPHDYALRPSDAGALDKADAVFWIGEALTPWLEKPLEALAGDAVAVELLHAPGVESVEADDDDGHDHADHGTEDPHIWLDPVNAAAIVDRIAETLAALDAENADAYRGNASAARQRLNALLAEIAGALPAPKPYIVFHDAYSHFERRFGLAPAAAVSLSNADRPGPKRIAEVRRGLDGVVCAFAEPQFPERTLRMVTRGANTRVGILDPLGAGFEPGPGLYADMMLGMVESMRKCLK